MHRRAPRKLLGSLAGLALLPAIALLLSRGNSPVPASTGEGGLGSNTGAGAAHQAGVAPPWSAPSSEGGASDGTTTVRLLHAPGGRVGLDPLLTGVSQAFGLAQPAATGAGFDLGGIIGAIGLDRLGSLTHGLIGLVVDDVGLSLSFDAGVVTRTWERFVGTVAQWWHSGLRHAADVQEQASVWAMTWFDGNQPVPPPPDEQMPRRAILLVQGVDGPGEGWFESSRLEPTPAGAEPVGPVHGVWNDLVPALCDLGQMAVQFEYARDAPLRVSADGLGEALVSLRAHGVEEVDFVTHSAGGLVVRDVLTRHEWYGSSGEGGDRLPKVRRLIMVGPPNGGTNNAAGTTARRAIMAARTSERHESRPFATGRSADGGGSRVRAASTSSSVGEEGDPAGVRNFAGSIEELRPGSAYLSELNARPLPGDVHTTIIAGRHVNHDVDGAVIEGTPTVGPPRAEATRARRAAIAWLGDGVVSLESAMLPGVKDVVVLPGNHRSLLVRRKPGEVPPAVPVILERLSDGWR